VTGDPYNVREGETAEQFGDRIKALHTAPTWAEMRARADHADDAYRFLSSAPFNGDAEMARVMVDAATVHATLALHDKVEELTQTIKRGVEQMIETNAELSDTIKKATNSIVIELRKTPLREVA
jgi:hypothetical protein